MDSYIVGMCTNLKTPRLLKKCSWATIYPVKTEDEIVHEGLKLFSDELNY
jgi:hypothetical protein